MCVCVCVCVCVNERERKGERERALRDLVSALILQHLAMFAHAHTQPVLPVIVTVLLLLMEIYLSPCRRAY